MIKTKKFIWILTTIFMSLVLIGCSADVLIRVGTPYNYKGTDGVKFDKNEITNSGAIAKLRKIIKNSKEIEKPNVVENVAEVFFSLDRPKDSLSEIRRYIWYQDDGSSILYDGDSGYSTLTKEQTNELKRILESK
jgi:hypothetical protein